MSRTGGGVRAGTVFGFPLVIDVSVLYLGPIIALMVVSQASSGGLLRALLQFPIIFASVFLHELAHALTARSLGVPVRHIALTWFGGYAAFWTPPKRWREAVIAFAGPASNLALAVALFAVLPLVETQSAGITGANLWVRAGPTPLAEHLVRTAAVINLGLGIFNLLPALPLDGGHILRTILASFLPWAQAHRLAAWSGIVLGALVAAYAMWAESLWTLVIGGFIAYIAWNQRRVEDH